MQILQVFNDCEGRIRWATGKTDRLSPIHSLAGTLRRQSAPHIRQEKHRIAYAFAECDGGASAAFEHDLNVIALWLGHQSTPMTHGYSGD